MLFSGVVGCLRMFSFVIPSYIIYSKCTGVKTVTRKMCLGMSYGAFWRLDLVSRLTLSVNKAEKLIWS